jgi:hypothetical protein
MQQKGFRKQIVFAALLTAVLMWIFFFICKAKGFQYMSGLHLVNNLLIIAPVWYSIYLIHSLRLTPYPYLRGLSSGVGAAAVTAFIFSFLMLIYLFFVDRTYLFDVKDNAPLGQYMSPIVIALVFFTEQVCSGLISALILMQLYKPR